MFLKGREKLPVSEAVAAVLEEMGRQVAEAVARGELQRARELTEEAILLRASEGPCQTTMRSRRAAGPARSGPTSSGTNIAGSCE
jgi:hypothetical protein